jgi:glutamate/tyrosine decarboxylase-like PLP-dependent enzyme
MFVGVIFVAVKTVIEAGIVKDFPSLWLHVDAAWAGSALSCPEYREMCHLEEINAVATSFCTNFHKVRIPEFNRPVTHEDVSSGA